MGMKCMFLNFGGFRIYPHLLKLLFQGRHFKTLTEHEELYRALRDALGLVTSA
jgi:hypothetical protein